MFPPSSPAVIPSFDNVWNGAIATNPDYVFAPPVFFEVGERLAQDETNLKHPRFGARIQIRSSSYRACERASYVLSVSLFVPELMFVFQLFGGAPMSKMIGDYLAREGCSLYSLYGMCVIPAKPEFLAAILNAFSQNGGWRLVQSSAWYVLFSLQQQSMGPTASDLDRNGMNWEYLQINSGLTTVFVPQGDGTSELVVVVCSPLVVSNRD